MEIQTPIPAVSIKPKKKIWGIVYDFLLLVFFVCGLYILKKILTVCGIQDCSNPGLFLSPLAILLFFIYLIRILRNRVRFFNSTTKRILMQIILILAFVFIIKNFIPVEKDVVPYGGCPPGYIMFDEICMPKPVE